MTEIGQRLRQAIEDQGHTISGLSQALGSDGLGVTGASRKSIHTYIAKDADREPSLEFLRAAAEELDVREEWLILGRGEMTETREVVERGVDQERRPVGGPQYARDPETVAEVIQRLEPRERDEELRREAFGRIGNLQYLSLEARHLFRRLVADWVDATPDTGLLKSTEDMRALTHAARSLNRVIQLLYWYSAPWARGGRDTETDPDEFETYFTSMIHVLRPVLTGETRRERPLSDPAASPVVLLAENLWRFQDELDEVEGS